MLASSSSKIDASQRVVAFGPAVAYRLAVSAPTDMFHTNRFAELLSRADRSKYTKLFG